MIGTLNSYLLLLPSSVVQ